MEAVTAQDQQALLAHSPRTTRSSTASCATCARSTTSCKASATDREQHRLLRDACGALEALGGIGGAALFWASTPPPTPARTDAPLRSLVDAFEQRVTEIEDRRRAVLAEIERQQELNYLLEDDLFEAQEEEERRRQEWIVDRELDVLPGRAAPLPWTRGGEDDRRFRKSLAVSLLVSLIFALLVPTIVLLCCRRPTRRCRCRIAWCA